MSHQVHEHDVDMKRLPTLAGLACLFAVTQVAAEDVTVAPQTPAPHRAKAKAAKPAPLRSASLGAIPFSDPYAPPIGSGKVKSGDFPLPERAIPVEPQGGFSLHAGKDAPDAPMRGGLMFRF
jgi:hypothetical protein